MLGYRYLILFLNQNHIHSFYFVRKGELLAPSLLPQHSGGRGSCNPFQSCFSFKHLMVVITTRLAKLELGLGGNIILLSRFSILLDSESPGSQLLSELCDNQGIFLELLVLQLVALKIVDQMLSRKLLWVEI